MLISMKNDFRTIYRPGVEKTPFHFDDNTGVGSVKSATSGTGNAAWYTLDGVKLNGEPEAKGVYVNSERKYAR